MSNKHEKMRQFTRWYKHEKKISAVTMAEVVDAAMERGWKLPPPITGKERLVKQFTDAQREEMGYDKELKQPYRANLAVTQRLKNGVQLPLWVETDEASRSQLKMAMHKYREQMIGEAVIGTNTVNHWNRINPTEQPVLFPTDFEDEVKWRLNSSVEDEEEGAA